MSKKGSTAKKKQAGKNGNGVRPRRVKPGNAMGCNLEFKTLLKKRLRNEP